MRSNIRQTREHIKNTTRLWRKFKIVQRSARSVVRCKWNALCRSNLELTATLMLLRKRTSCLHGLMRINCTRSKSSSPRKWRKVAGITTMRFGFFLLSSHYLQLAKLGRSCSTAKQRNTNTGNRDRLLATEFGIPNEMNTDSRRRVREIHSSRIGEVSGRLVSDARGVDCMNFISFPLLLHRYSIPAVWY